MAVSQVLLAIGKENPMLKLNKEYAEKFYKAYPEDMERAIEQLRGGDDRTLPLLYKGLVHKDGQIVNKAAEEIAGFCRMSAMEYLRSYEKVLSLI